MAINWLNIVEEAGNIVTQVASEDMQEYTEELFGYGNTMIDLCKDLGAEAMLFAAVVGKMVNLAVTGTDTHAETRGIDVAPKISALAAEGHRRLSA